jgi:5-formyltetrahydrofolate cyclo-ligase
MRGHRKLLRARTPDAAERAAAHAPPALLSARVVAGYRPQGGEIDPWPLLRRLERAGARIALPRAEDRAAPLVFRAHHEGDPLTPDVFGVPAPPAEAPILTPDLIVTPLLAFDRRGGRMGQGAGCYDRTLAFARGSGAVIVVGLAYAGQEVVAVPAEPHDQLLDAILTETGYTEFQRIY